MEAVRKGWQTLKKRRLLLNIFVVLLGLSLLCAFFCTFYLGRIILRERNDQVMELSMGRLVEAREEVDAHINALSSYLWGNLWLPDIVDLMISTDLSDRPRNTRIVTELSSKVAQYPLVSEAVVYSEQLEYVLLSNGFWMPLASYDRQEQVEAYLDQRKVLDESSLLDFGRLYQSGEELYLCFDQETPVYVGSLIFRLETDQLAAMLETGDGPIYVLDGEGNFVFQPTESVDFTDPNLLFLEEKDLNTAERSVQESIYYKTVSDVTGWTFLFPAKMGSMWDYLPEFLPLIFPFLLLYILLCAVLSYMLSKNLYRPIHTLLDVSGAHRTQKMDAHWEEATDEVTFLKNIYEETFDANQQYQNDLAAVSQEVRDQVLYKLLVSRNVSWDYVENTLTSVGSGMLLQCQVVVQAALMELHETENEASVEWAIFRQSLISIIQNSAPAPCQPLCYVLDGNKLAVILTFPQEATPNRIGETVRTIRQAVAKATANTPANLFWGGSQVYSDLKGLNAAWGEAVQAAMCRRYADDNCPSEEIFLQVQENDEAYLLQLLKQALDVAAEGRTAESEEAVRTLCGKIREKEEYGVLELLHDSAVETLTLYGVESEDMAWLSEKWEGSNPSGETLETFLKEAARLLQVNGRKNKFKYVDEAKAYVSRNYMNSDLSLNAVSEYIGISSTYLSTLFKEIAKEKFNSYLNVYRVEQAKILLRNTTLSNADIGYRCGFSSNQSFYRVFKKVINQTPSQYRETLRKEDGSHGQV